MTDRDTGQASSTGARPRPGYGHLEFSGTEDSRSSALDMDTEEQNKTVNKGTADNEDFEGFNKDDGFEIVKNKRKKVNANIGIAAEHNESTSKKIVIVILVKT